MCKSKQASTFNTICIATAMMVTIAGCSSGGGSGSSAVSSAGTSFNIEKTNQTNSSQTNSGANQAASLVTTTAQPGTAVGSANIPNVNVEIIASRQGVYCAPTALYSSDSASNVVITGENFGDSMGTVTLVRQGKAASYLSVSGWSNKSVNFNIDPRVLNEGNYYLTVAPVNGQSFNTQYFSIVSPSQPLLNECYFSSSPMQGRELPEIIVKGRNFWNGTSMPVDFKLFAKIDNNEPFELSLNSYDVTSGIYTVAATAPASLKLNGSTIYFFAANKDVNSNILSETLHTEGKIYALFVGINKYKNISQLDFCVNDSDSMKAGLTQGAKNSMWANAEIISLNDTDATKSNITNTIKSIAAKIKSSDTFLMYYSGHGASSGSSNPETYICPVDTLTTATALSSTELKNLLLQMPDSSKKLLFFDSCYSGGFIGKSADRRVKYVNLEYVPSTEEGISFKAIGNVIRNVFFSTASKGSEFSYEMSSIQHGAYTYYLLSGLGYNGSTLGEALVSNEDFIGFAELHNYAARNIVNIISGQTPQIYTSGGNANTVIKGNI